MFTRALTKSLKYVGIWGDVEQNGIKWGYLKRLPNYTYISMSINR
jgi:hypothetical protein